MVSILLGLVAGIATPTQTSINGRLRENDRSAYLTTLVSFGGAVIILIMIALLTQGGLFIPFGRIAEEPLWIWSGGLCGTIIILMNTVCLPHLGSANTVVLVSTGQIITGLLIDQFGFFDSPEVHMDLLRTIGAVLVIAGVLLVSYEKDTSRTPLTGKLIYIIGALIGGAACGIQVAVNGALSVVTGSSVQTTLISMSIGLISTALLILLMVLIRGMDSIFDDVTQAADRGYKWWMFTGGAFGVIVVLSNAIIAPVLGAGLVTVLNLVGMMGTGLLIDATGFLGIDRKPVTAAKTIGMIAMTAGTILISLI